MGPQTNKDKDKKEKNTKHVLLAYNNLEALPIGEAIECMCKNNAESHICLPVSMRNVLFRSSGGQKALCRHKKASRLCPKVTCRVAMLRTAAGVFKQINGLDTDMALAHGHALLASHYLILPGHLSLAMEICCDNSVIYWFCSRFRCSSLCQVVLTLYPLRIHLFGGLTVCDLSQTRACLRTCLPEVSRQMQCLQGAL